MRELLLHTIIDKLNMESQDIETIKEKIEGFPDNAEALRHLNTCLVLK